MIQRSPRPLLPFTCIAFLLAGAGLAAQTGSAVSTTSLPAVSRLERIWAGGVPKDAADLAAMEQHVQQLLARVLPATVGIGGGAGVIIEGGYVLTAGHVIQRPGRDVTIVLQDGKRLRGKTLGANHRADSGLVKITSEGPCPALEMGHSADLKPGQWCMLLGYPGGRRNGRQAPLRLGRILRVPDSGYLVTDCTISSGDSGGPLFDMQGRVIGINSRIANNLAMNMHVPIDAFHDDWRMLVEGKMEGSPPNTATRRGGYLGIRHDPGSDEVLVLEVVADTAAARAGLKAGDVILKVGGRSVQNGDALQRQLQRRRPGDRVTLEIRRGEQTMTLDATLGRWPE